MIEYDIKEKYKDSYVFLGKHDGTTFSYEMEIPAKKVTNEHFLRKAKNKIEKMFEKHQKMALVFDAVVSKCNKIEKKYYHETYPKYRRFTVSENLSFVLVLTQGDEETFIDLVYEQYDRAVTIWQKKRIVRFTHHSRLKEEIELTLKHEWLLCEEQNQWSLTIQAAFTDVLGLHILPMNVGTYYIYESEASSKSRTFARYASEQGELTVLLEKLENGHRFVFGHEVLHPGYRNVKQFKSWFVSELSPILLHKELLAIKNEQQQAVEKTSFIQKLVAKLNSKSV